MSVTIERESGEVPICILLTCIYYLKSYCFVKTFCNSPSQIFVVDIYRLCVWYPRLIVTSRRGRPGHYNRPRYQTPRGSKKNVGIMTRPLRPTRKFSRGIILRPLNNSSCDSKSKSRFEFYRKPWNFSTRNMNNHESLLFLTYLKATLPPADEKELEKCQTKSAEIKYTNEIS